MVDAAHETETAILDAALAEVLAHGIRRTTASDIARRCGIARQTLYRYWPDAQAIFAALVTRELVAALPADAADGADLEGTVGLLVPELFARYILDRLGPSQRDIHAQPARRLAAGQATGAVREGDPARLAAMVLLITQSAVQSAPLVAEWLPADAWRAELGAALRGYLSPKAV